MEKGRPTEQKIYRNKFKCDAIMRWSNWSDPIPPCCPRVRGKMCVIKKDRALENDVMKEGALVNKGIELIN